MKEDKLYQLFNDLEGKFDTESPSLGHERRFLDKLQTQSDSDSKLKTLHPKAWRNVIAIAASLVLCFSIFILVESSTETHDLASVSPELSETQDFFTVTIENELRKLNKEKTPFTETIISDAMVEIQSLEKDYENLKILLTESGEDKRVIYAMIANFQSRIDILNTVLEEIETIKQLNINTDVTKNTL